MNRLKSFFEVRAFGVCSYLGEKLGIASTHIRLFFIYLSFVTLASPVILYLSLAFLIRIRNYFRAKLNPFWDV